MSEPEEERGVQALPHPVMQAILCADNAIREAGTNKVTLVGIFERIFGRAFPLSFARPIFIYARLTDAQGTYPVRLELVRLDDDEQAVGRLEGHIVVADRLAAAELVFTLTGGTFERPGRYEFRLFAGGRFVIGGAVLNVVQQDQAPQGG